MTTHPATPPGAAPQPAGSTPATPATRQKPGLLTIAAVLVALVGFAAAYFFLQQASTARREATRALALAEANAQAAEQEIKVNKILLSSLGRVQPDANGNEPTISDILPQMESQVGQLDEGPSRGHFLLGLAKIYNRLGKFSDAAATARSALALLDDHVQADAKELIEAQAQLAFNQLLAGDIPEGTALLEQLVEDAETILAPTDPLRLAILNASANAAFMHGNTEQGLQRARHVIASREQSPQNEDPNLLFALTTQVMVFAADGEIEKAIPIAQRVSALWDRYNPQHIAATAARSTLANLQSRQGDTAPETVAAHRAVVDRLRVELGENDPQTLRVTSNYLMALLQTKDFQRVIEQGEPAAAKCVEQLPAGSPITAMTQNALALAYHFSERSADAVPIMRQVLDSTRAANGESDPQTLEIIGNLCKIEMSAGLPEDALATGQEAVQLMRTHLGAEHARTQAAVSSLAEICILNQRYALAVDLLSDHYQWRKQTAGTGNPATLAVGSRLGAMLRFAGQPDQAGSIAEEVVQAATDQYGPNHPQALTGRILIARTYTDVGKSAEAKAVAEEVLNRCLETLGPENGLTCDARGCLIESLLAAEDYSTAETVASELLAVVKDAPFANTLRIALAANMLAEAQLGQGNSAAAAKLLSRVAAALEQEHPDHTLTATSQLLLGMALLDEQDLDAAQTNLLKAERLLASMRDKLSVDEKKRWNSTRAKLAELFAAQGQPEEAAKYRDNKNSTNDRNQVEP